jgi:hypothetical protein
VFDRQRGFDAHVTRTRGCNYEDRLTDDSLVNWSGGRLVRVGASGDCSLFVGPNETATLASTLVNDSSDILTGTVDLGANGSLSLVADGSSLTVANPGPDYATALRVSTGDRRERVTLETGRFFDFIARADGNQTRFAVWSSDDSWDGDWDVRFAASFPDGWQLRLLGVAYLDEIAIGTERPEPTPTATATPTETDSGGFEGAPDFPDSEGFPDQPDQRTDDPGAGAAVVGLIFHLFGSVGAAFPRRIARVTEQIDAIGSTRPMGEVEPAE